MSKRMSRLEELSEYLVGIEEPVFKVTIRRTEPEDYAGYLDTIDVHEPEDISLNTLIELYGGGRYSLRIKDAQGRYVGHRTIQICGRPLQRGRSSRREKLQEIESVTLRKEVAFLRAEQKQLRERVDALSAQMGMLAGIQ
jgi:hypothetical protein